MTNHLRTLRVERAWTQADLAKLLAISRQTVNALERGRRSPSLPLAYRIASLFHRPVDEIFHPDSSAPRL